MFAVNSEGEAVEFEHMPPWETTNKMPREEDGPERETHMADKNLPPDWPSGVGWQHRPALLAAIVGSTGVVVGSVGTWAKVLWFTVGGLDFGNWGVAILILGVMCASALTAIKHWSRTSVDPRWGVAIAWGIVVIGVACLTIAVINIIRLITVPKENLFGVPIGASAGWGLWLAAFSSVTICVAGTMLSRQIATSLDRHQGIDESASSWSKLWRRAAIAISALVVVVGAIYALSNPWKGATPDSARTTTLPSFPSFPSIPDFSTTTTSSSPPPLSSTASSTITWSTPSSTYVQTTESAVSGDPCSDLGKLAREAGTGRELYCAMFSASHWTWSQTPANLNGIHTTDSSCDPRLELMARSPDGYVIMCQASFGPRGAPLGMGTWQHFQSMFE